MTSEEFQRKLGELIDEASKDISIFHIHGLMQFHIFMSSQKQLQNVLDLAKEAESFFNRQH